MLGQNSGTTLSLFLELNFVKKIIFLIKYIAKLKNPCKICLVAPSCNKIEYDCQNLAAHKGVSRSWDHFWGDLTDNILLIIIAIILISVATALCCGFGLVVLYATGIVDISWNLPWG